MLSKPLVASALLSTAVLHLEGNVISNAPKKEAANTTSIRQKRILNTAFVESAFSALAPKIKRNGQSERHINHYDGSTIRPCITDAFLLILATLQEEADRHRDDGPYTGGEERQQSAGKSRNENINPGHVFLRSGFAQRIAVH